MTSRSSSGSRGTSIRRRCSSASARRTSREGTSSANDSSSTASSRAAPRASPAAVHSRAAATVGARAAYRLFSVRTRSWSPWTAGSASCCSSSAYSSRIDWTDSSTAGPSAQGRSGDGRIRRTPAPDDRSRGSRRAGDLLGGLLAVTGLEPGHAATGVEDLLLARVERVALRAHVGGDLAGRLGAARGERVATGTGDRGLHVVGVKVLLQRCLLEVVGRVGVIAAHAGELLSREPVQRKSVPDRRTSSQTHGRPSAFPHAPP